MAARVVTQHVEPFSASFLRFVVASFFLILLTSIFYLGFFGTVLGFLWYYEGIQVIGPSRAAVFINLV
ncbi:MAG: hypothetical protein NTY16_04315, partial [Deltaproteobacteria bacterium]|nr:hypothetical protein [Deltaproteobacteria bacterium]